MIDEESEKLYIQSLEEFVLDENKIVTYKWLSKTLGIHVNIAKQLLYAFSTESDEAKKVGIKKTYLISGIMCNDLGCKVVVVKEDDLNKVKSLFKVITSEHLYSVQKCKNNTDIKHLYKIDCLKKDDSDKPVAAISCSKSLPRTDSELITSRLKAAAVVATADTQQWPGAAITKKAPDESISKKNFDNSDGNGVSALEEKNNVDISAARKGSAKTGGIAAMFAAQSNKAQKTTDVNSKTSNKINSNAKKGGITTFFTKNLEKANNSSVKSTADQQTSEISPEKKSESVKDKFSPNRAEGNKLLVTKREMDYESDDTGSSCKKKQKISVSDKDAAKKKKAEEKSKKAEEKSKKAENKKKANNKRERNHVATQSPKKRRRIITPDSDSDDDMFEKDEIPESPPPFEEQEPPVVSQQDEMEDIIPCTPQQELSKGRKRKRILVDRTFLDDDGYMVTKKEFVYESCSASENEEEKENDTKVKEDTKTVETAKTVESTKTVESAKSVMKHAKGNTKKKVSPQQHSKQSTLMNFFKKN